MMNLQSNRLLYRFCETEALKLNRGSWVRKLPQKKKQGGELDEKERDGTVSRTDADRCAGGGNTDLMHIWFCQ